MSCRKKLGIMSSPRKYLRNLIYDKYQPLILTFLNKVKDRAEIVLRYGELSQGVLSRHRRGGGTDD